jgi:Tfp pilus assembly protein PilZ
VTIRREQGEKETILTHTENLGIGGICVILKKSYKLFSPVLVEIDLLDMLEHMHCDGRIVWSVRRKAGDDKHPQFYDTGIEFTNLAERDLARIEEIVKKMVRKGLVA